MASEARACGNLEGLVRRLRLRLADAGRAGLAAVPRITVAAAHPAPTNGACRASAAAESAQPAPASASPSLAPELRAAETLREELAMAAKQHPEEGQDFFDFGAPDLEGGVNRDEALRRIAAEVAECTLCKELASTRTQTVPGQGDPQARLAFVGEGPGEEEDRQGLAFVGRAGQLLTKMIESIGLTRDRVFICNILKCRPPGNRNPMPDEIANCLPYLMRQLEILRPKIICALGNAAAQTLLQTHDGITRLRGRFHPWRGTLLMPTFHPAYVLRNYTTDTRKKVYEDLLQVQAELAKR